MTTGDKYPFSPSLTSSAIIRRSDGCPASIRGRISSSRFSVFLHILVNIKEMELYVLTSLPGINYCPPLMKNAMEYVSNRLPDRNLVRIYPAQRFFSSSDTRKIPCFPDVPELEPYCYPLKLRVRNSAGALARTANSRASLPCQFQLCSVHQNVPS